MHLHETTEHLTAVRGDPRPPSDRRAFPTDVARSLSSLAHLIDQRIEERGIIGGVASFAARSLGRRRGDLEETSITVTGVGYQCLAVALDADLRAHPPVEVVGADEDEGPEYESVELGSEVARLPLTLAASWPAGGPVGCPAVVSVIHHWGRGVVFSVWTGPDDTPAASAYLAGLESRGRGPLNPFRGRMLRAGQHGRAGVIFSAASCPATSRADVVLPDELWEEIDRNVLGLFAAHELLAECGLAVNRGLLLAGPPGTGKTAVCRSLAHELVGEVTVVFADAAALAHAVLMLYQEVAHLSPALVVLEDIDLVVGRRELQHNPEALQDFLVALDGGLSHQAGIVTLATTNAPEAIDPAARRAARFDATLEVPTPPLGGRRRILERYLSAVAAVEPHGLDVDRLAVATDGWSGAELRELVSRAVIGVADARRRGAAEALTTERVLALVSERPGADVPGQYL
jgi:hypothetical protein